MVDHDPNCMINVDPPCALRPPPAPPKFLQPPGHQYPAGTRFALLQRSQQVEPARGRFVNHAHFTALRDKPAELLPGDLASCKNGFSHPACLINITSLPPSNHQQMTGYHQTMLPRNQPVLHLAYQLPLLLPVHFQPHFHSWFISDNRATTLRPLNLPIATMSSASWRASGRVSMKAPVPTLTSSTIA